MTKLYNDEDITLNLDGCEVNLTFKEYNCFRVLNDIHIWVNECEVRLSNTLDRVLGFRNASVDTEYPTGERGEIYEMDSTEVLYYLNLIWGKMTIEFLG